MSVWITKALKKEFSWPAMLVVVDRALRGESPSSDQELALNSLVTLIARDRAAKKRPSSVDPRVAASAVTAMLWGLNTLEPRWGLLSSGPAAA